MTETTSENKKSPEYVAHSSTPKTEKEETTIDLFSHLFNARVFILNTLMLIFVLT
jgi:hypothetical protein